MHILWEYINKGDDSMDGKSIIERTQKLLDSISLYNLEGKVITIIGASGLGKTTFACMQLPMFLFKGYSGSPTLNEKQKFIVMNTDNSLLCERFSQVLKHYDVNYSEFRKHLNIIQVNSFAHQDELIRTLFKQSVENKQIEPLYVVIDPFNHNLRVEFAKTKEEYRLNVVGRLSPRLEYQLMLLNTLARKMATTVVLTLLPKKKYTDFVPDRWQNAYFGPLEIGHLSDVVLWFSQNVQAARGVTIHVKKHRFAEANKQILCKLTEEGLMLQ